MTLQEVFDHLSYGELSQLHIGGSEDAGITEENRYRIVTHVNLGLTALHKRFFLRRGEAQVYVSPGMSSYTVEQGDLFKIEQVHTADGCELGIGEGNANSVTLDSFNTLRVPLEIRMKGEPLTVVYRADHPTIDKRMAARDPERIQINLPPTHLEALLYFVASRLFNPLGGSVESHEGNNYARKYEAECRALENGGMQISEQRGQTKFERNGWV